MSKTDMVDAFNRAYGVRNTAYDKFTVRRYGRRYEISDEALANDAAKGTRFSILGRRMREREERQVLRVIKEGIKVKEQKNEYEITTETAGFVFHVYFNTECETTVGKLMRVPKEFYHYVNSTEVTSRVEKTVCSAEDEYKAHIGMNIVKHKLVSWIKGLAFQRMKHIEEGIYAAAHAAIVATRNEQRKAPAGSSWKTCGCSGCKALRGDNRPGVSHEELMDAVKEFQQAGGTTMNRAVTTGKPGHLMAAAVRKVTGK